MRTEPFQPLPLLRNAHAQTIAAAKLTRPLAPPAEKVEVKLPDGDRLALEVSTPPAWTPGQPTALLLHGATGTHRSPYMVRAAARLLQHGVRAVRMNLRGSGSGVGWARRPYSLGCSDDLLAAVRVLRAGAPRGTLTLVGFSLGGNIVLKLAAELGPDAGDLVSNAIVFCPGTDLWACYLHIHRPRNRIYEYTFVSNLRRELEDRLRAFPDLPRPDLPRGPLGLFEFDDRYTAPTLGFPGTESYYRACSAKPHVGRIRLPCRVIHSDDDPISEPRSLDDVALPACVDLVKVPHGGHLGFLARPSAGGVHWMNTQILRFLIERGDAPAPPA